MKKILLLSYPRSGSNFTTYILDFLLKHPFWFDKQGNYVWLPGTVGSGKGKTLKDIGPRSIHVPDEAAIISKTTGEKYAPGMPIDSDSYEPSRVWKLHGQHHCGKREIQDVLEEEPILLLLLRNPFEAFHSHLRDEGFGIRKHSASMPTPFDDPIMRDDWHYTVTGYFFENLKTFHSYKGKKKVIFYEDLVSTPASYIKELCHFLGTGTSVGDLFMSQYKTHFKISRHLYKNNQRECKTEGTTTDDFLTSFEEHMGKEYVEAFWRIFFDLCARTETNGAEEYCRRYYEDFIGSQQNL